MKENTIFLEILSFELLLLDVLLKLYENILKFTVVKYLPEHV